MIEKGSCWSKWSTGISQVTLPLVQGGRRGVRVKVAQWDSTRLSPMWPEFKSRRRRHMWVEFVVGSFLCSEKIFAGYSVFLAFLKSQHFQISISTRNTNREPLCACATSKPLFTYVFISLFQFFYCFSFCSLVLSRFLDVTQRSRNARCVTSKKRLRGRLQFLWLF